MVLCCWWKCSQFLLFCATVKHLSRSTLSPTRNPTNRTIEGSRMTRENEKENCANETICFQVECRVQCALVYTLLRCACVHLNFLAIGTWNAPETLAFYIASSCVFMCISIYDFRICSEFESKISSFIRITANILRSLQTVWMRDATVNAL